MCFLCLELAKAFNRTLKKAQDLKDTHFENRVRGRREWFLERIYEKDCKESKRMFSDYGLEFFAKDSDILDGKRWEDHLDDAEFKARDKVPFPPQSTEEAMVFGEGKVELTPEGLKYVMPSSEPGKVTVSAELAKENKDLTKKICEHLWILYEGAGTVKPETICKNCGCSK